MKYTTQWSGQKQLALVSASYLTLYGDLHIPRDARGMIICAQSSANSRYSPQARRISYLLHKAAFATFTLDLLTVEEAIVDERTRHLSFDIALLAERLNGVINGLVQHLLPPALPVGLFGIGTSASAALLVAAHRTDAAQAIVACEGRPDLIAADLAHIQTPTLFLVGANDTRAIEQHPDQFNQIPANTKLALVPGTTELFGAPQSLEATVQLARGWFAQHLVVTAAAA